MSQRLAEIGEDHLHIIEKGVAQKWSLVVHRNLMSQPKKKQQFRYKPKIGEIGLKAFNYRCPETKIFHFFKENSWSKVSNAF